MALAFYELANPVRSVNDARDLPELLGA
jgi:hypothetical protein